MPDTTKNPKHNSIKAKQVVSQLLDNSGTNSVGQAMRNAGYGKGYAKNPQIFKATKEYQDLVDPLIRKLDDEINAALDELPKKRGEARYGELGGVIVKLIEKKQLLGGKPTARHDFSNLSTDELQKLAAGSNSGASEEGASKEEV